MTFAKQEFVFASSGKASGLHPDITGSLSGVESIDNAFKELDADIRKRMLSKAMRKAHKPFKDEIKRGTSKGPTGKLRAAAMTKVKVNRQTGFIHSFTGYRRRGRRGAPHAHLVEWGTGTRIWRGFAVGGRPVKAGSNIFRARRAEWSVGPMRAQEVQTKSFAKHKDKPAVIFKEFVRKSVKRAMAKARR